MMNLNNLLGSRFEDVIEDNEFTIVDSNSIRIDGGYYEGIVIVSEHPIIWDEDCDDAYMGHIITDAYYEYASDVKEESEEESSKESEMTLLQDVEFPKHLEMISVEEFKQRSYKKGTLEYMVSLIDHIDKLPEGGYRCHLSTGESLAVRPDGSHSKGDAPFELTEDIKSTDHLVDGQLIQKINSVRPRVNNFGSYNCSLFTEKFFGICEQWLSGMLPTNFKGLQVNVKDHSGNKVTAEKLGIPFNMALWNLEWCLACDNARAGHIALYLKRLTGKVYSFSCNDMIFKFTVEHNSRKDICDYCEQNFIEVKTSK